MATQVSAIYYRWASRCHASASLVEEAISTLLSGGSPGLCRVENAVRDAIQSYEEIGEPPIEELRRMAPPGLHFADDVREFIELAKLPVDHELRLLHDELADHAELIADSVDENLIDSHRVAMQELARGELTPLSELQSH